MGFLNKLKQAKDKVAEAIEDTIALAPEELVTKRLEICHACPSLGVLNRCKECGCFMDAKTRLMNVECPLKKW